MFNLFQGDRNDNERDDGGPRIVFANLRRRSRPILSEQGYVAFSATTFSIWALLIFVIWVFRIEVLLTQDTITSIAGSSVELAALSLAVLGILHELNKQDRWFKLGLFLVSIFFVCVVFNGFFLSMTWQPSYNNPQHITVLVIAALGVVAVTQFNWRVILKYVRLRWITTITLPSKVSVALRRFRLSFPFIIPFFLIWFPDLNRLTATVVVFSGALIALVALMGVTTISILRSPNEAEPEDPFIATLRARYESEVKTIIRFGELKAKTVEAISHFQTERVKVTSQVKEAPPLVDKSSIIVRLRQMDVTDDERVLENVLTFLVNEGVVCRESYSGPYWIVPNKQTIDECLEHLREIALVITQQGSLAKSNFNLEGYKFDALRDWLAVRTNLPILVVEAYIMPKVLERLEESENYQIEKNTFRSQGFSETYVYEIFVFINRNWMIPSRNWNHQAQEIQDILTQLQQQRFKKYERRTAIEELLERLPHTLDVSIHLLERTNFHRIVSTLLEAHGIHVESP